MEVEYRSGVQRLRGAALGVLDFRVPPWGEGAARIYSKQTYWGTVLVQGHHPSGHPRARARLCSPRLLVAIPTPSRQPACLGEYIRGDGAAEGAEKQGLIQVAQSNPPHSHN